MHVYSKEFSLDEDLGKNSEFSYVVNRNVFWVTVALNVSHIIYEATVISFRPFYEYSLTPFYKEETIVSEYHYYYGVEFVVSGILKS